MKQLNEKLFKSTKLIKILKQKANVLDMILKQFPHVSNETASDYVTLNNTAKAPMEIETIPQTSQETTSGKNLLKITNDTDFVNHGVTTKMSNGVLSVSGTSDTIWANITRVVFLDKELPVGTYTFSIDKAINCDLVIRLIGDNTNGYQITKNSTSKTFTTTEVKDRFYLFIQNLTAEEQINFEFKPQLELGSEATSYEPYTGGIPAPNPDYPQEIHRTTGDNSVIIKGKNLYSGGDESFIQASPFINLEPIPAGTYKLICDITSNDTDTQGSAFMLFDSNGDITWSAPLGRTHINRSITLSREAVKARFYASGAWGTSAGDTASFKNIMITTSNDDSYLPYESTTYPLSLGNKEMFNINGVYDGFVYDEMTDKFYFRRWNRKIELAIADMNNSENYPGWKNIAQVKADFPEAAIPLGRDYDYLCNIHKKSVYGIYIDNRNLAGNIYLNKDTFNLTQSQWKTNYPNLVVALAYNLKTYIDEEITDTTLISQLRAIKDTLSMQGATHIISTATGENLPFFINASAVKSFE